MVEDGDDKTCEDDKQVSDPTGPFRDGISAQGLGVRVRNVRRDRDRGGSDKNSKHTQSGVRVDLKTSIRGW